MSTNTTRTYVGTARGGGICDIQNPTWNRVFVTTLSLLSLVGTVENIVVLITICKYKVLHKPHALLIAALSTVDLIVGSIITPSTIVVATTVQDFPFFNEYVAVFRTFVFISMSTVLLISVDRFFTVVFVERYVLTRRRLFLGLTCCWAIPLTIGVCWLSEWQVQEVTRFAIAYFFFCFSAVVVLYVCVFMYVKMYAGIWGISGHENNHRHENDNSNINSNSNNSNNNNCLYQETITTTLIILTTCILTNIPPVCDIILRAKGVWSSGLCGVTHLTLLSNPVLNPLIYTSRIPVIRHHVYKMVTCGGAHNENDEQMFLTEVVVADDALVGV